MNPYTLDDAELQHFLHDDAPWGDATSWGLGISEQPGRMDFFARHAQVVCGSEEALRMGVLRGLQVAGPHVPSGSAVAPGTLLLSLTGRAGDLHRVWKPAQTLMEYGGGMATATAALVSAARQGRADVSVACTRKHMPGTRALSLKAILCGGASPHRLGISDSVLVFAEHRAFLGDLSPSAAIARLKQAWPDRKLLVEVDTLADAYLWIAAGADVIQLDKCSPAEVAQASAHAAQQTRPPLIAAAGGITPHNAHSFAQSGAHILVTSHPYQAAPKDVAVTIKASA